MAARYVLIGVFGSVIAALTSAGNPLRSGQSAPHPQRAGGMTRASALLVFPFENASRLAKLDWLGEGLSELTIERLASQGQFAFPREERLAAQEKLGLPASTRFSHATMLRIAEEVDADYIVFGRYASDGKTLTLTARVLRVSPSKLSPPIEESGALEGLMNAHARLAARVVRAVDPASSIGPGDLAQKLARRRLKAFEYYIRGLLGAGDDHRLRDFREAVRLEPSWEEPAFALGQAYYARRECEFALLWLSRVPPAHRRGAEASFDAGVCHLLRNDAARAEAAFANLLELVRPWAGELPEALNNLAVARMRMGKWREATAGLERATQLDPEETEYWFNLGLLNLRTKQPAAAVEPFREVLRRQPEDGEARALLIAALEQTSRASEAAAERKTPARAGGRPAALPSASPESLARLDRIKMRLDVAWLHPFPGNGAAGTESANSGDVSVHRRLHREIHLNRGREFLADGKLEEAEREFNQAIVLAPLNSPAAHQGLAEVFRRQGRNEDAIREMRAALASHDDAAMRTALARLFIEQNRAGEAREQLRLALKLDPNHAEARQWLDKLETRHNPGGP